MRLARDQAEVAPSGLQKRDTGEAFVLVEHAWKY